MECCNIDVLHFWFVTLGIFNSLRLITCKLAPSYMFLHSDFKVFILIYGIRSGGDCSIKFKNLMSEMSKSPALWEMYQSIRNE